MRLYPLLILLISFSIKELKDDVRDYMKFYNHRRFHEALKYKKPMEIYHNSLAINTKNYDDLDRNTR